MLLSKNTEIPAFNKVRRKLLLGLGGGLISAIIPYGVLVENNKGYGDANEVVVVDNWVMLKSDLL